MDYRPKKCKEKTCYCELKYLSSKVRLQSSSSVRLNVTLYGNRIFIGVIYIVIQDFIVSKSNMVSVLIKTNKNHNNGSKGKCWETMEAQSRGLQRTSSVGWMEFKFFLAPYGMLALLIPYFRLPSSAVLGDQYSSRIYMSCLVGLGSESQQISKAWTLR